MIHLRVLFVMRDVIKFPTSYIQKAYVLVYSLAAEPMRHRGSCLLRI